MANSSDELTSLILRELPEIEGTLADGKDLIAILTDMYGEPEQIRSNAADREIVFNLSDRKLGIIEDATSGEVIGFGIYHGEIPEAFAPKQAAPCVNGYVRTSTVTTTTLPVAVNLLNVLVTGPLLLVMAAANLIVHTRNIGAAKTAACAPCLLPCTCTAVTVPGSGTAAFAYAVTRRVLGVPVAANVSHVMTTNITATCV
jgi:hypothetical protein